MTAWFEARVRINAHPLAGVAEAICDRRLRRAGGAPAVRVGALPPSRGDSPGVFLNQRKGEG